MSTADSTLPTVPKRQIFFISMVILLLVLSINFFSWELNRSNVYQSSMNKFIDQASLIQNTIDTRVNKYEEGLIYGKEFMDSGLIIGRREFVDFYTREEGEKYPEIRGIFYVKHVTDKAAFEAVVRNDKSTSKYGFPFFKVYPTETKTQYDVITYLTSFEENKKLFGYDFDTDPAMQDYLKKAATSGSIVLTESMTMLEKRVVLAINAVYRYNEPQNTEAERLKALDGYIVYAIDSTTMFDNIMKQYIENEGENIHFKIYPAGIDESTYLASVPLYETTGSAIRLDKTKSFTQFRDFYAFDRKMTIVYYANINDEVALLDQYAPDILFSVSTFSLFILYIVMNRALYGKKSNELDEPSTPTTS